MRVQIIAKLTQNKTLLGGLIIVVSVLALQEIVDIQLGERAQNTITLALGVLYEALPFVVLGVTLSTLIQTFVASNTLAHRLPKQPILRRLALGLFGLFLPVCECGNVPLARGLIAKGLKPGDVMSFLLAAPIVNPITIYTTAIAFAGDSRVVVVRVVAGLVIAQLVAFAFSSSKQDILTKQFAAYCKAESKRKKATNGRIKLLFERASHELLELLPALAIGSLIAGLIQTTIPRDVLLALSDQPILAIVAMLFLAFVVSICANVDAFFALTLKGIFPTSAIIAFLVLGPMVDIKLLSMLRTTFTKRALVQMSALVFLLSFITGMVVHYVL